MTIVEWVMFIIFMMVVLYGATWGILWFLAWKICVRLKI